MRILRLELPATLVSTDPQFDLNKRAMRDRLHAELADLRPGLDDALRERVASFLPNDYGVFVRYAFTPDSEAARIHLWIDDPHIRWPAGLLARRAWKLSVPILAHAASDVFAQRLAGVDLVVDQPKARVTSLAPQRLWRDPLVLAASVAALATAFWLVLQPAIVSQFAPTIWTRAAQTQIGVPEPEPVP